MCFYDKMRYISFVYALVLILVLGFIAYASISPDYLRQPQIEVLNVVQVNGVNTIFPDISIVCKGDTLEWEMVLDYKIPYQYIEIIRVVRDIDNNRLIMRTLTESRIPQMEEGTFSRHPSYVVPGLPFGNYRLETLFRTSSSRHAAYVVPFEISC